MNRTLRAVLTALLVGAAALFLGLTVARNWADLQRYEWSVHWPLLALGMVLLTAVFAFSVGVWKLVLDRFEHPPVGVRTLLRIWFHSNLARYIPGKIWQFVGAAEMARAAGLSRAVLLTSMVVQMGFTVLAAATVAVMTLWPVYSRLGAGTGPALGLLAAASILLVHPRVLNTALRLVPRSLHGQVLRWEGRWRDGLLILALSVAAWLAYGVAFTLFVRSVVDVPASATIPLTGANALAFVVGYLAFVAPAGLGAREAALAVLLVPFAPAGVAAVVAVGARLWTVGAELLGAALVLLPGIRDGRPAPEP